MQDNFRTFVYVFNWFYIVEFGLETFPIYIVAIIQLFEL